MFNQILMYLLLFSTNNRPHSKRLRRQIRLQVHDGIRSPHLRHGFRHQFLCQVNGSHVCYVWCHWRHRSGVVLRHSRRFDSLLVRKEKGFRSWSGCEWRWVRNDCFRPAFHLVALRVRVERNLADLRWTLRQYVCMRSVDEEP